jgi:zinc D-Ala-D-Ala carboxypeptidase
MDRYGNTNAAIRPSARPSARSRGPAVRIGVPVLALVLAVTAVAAPAQAAATTATVQATGTVSATAGLTWSLAMRRKLGLGAESARLTAMQPALRGTCAARKAELARAQRNLRTATTTLIKATSTSQTTRTRYAMARTSTAAAVRAVAAARKRRPLMTSRVTMAMRTQTTATTTVRAWAVAVVRTTSALTAAQRVSTLATRQVGTATTLYLAANQAVGDTQRTITALPALSSALAVQAAAISAQVVTQTRADFTIAQTTQVYGVTVNKIVAFAFQRMIDDAGKAGIPLSGGGFRTRQQQIALRVANGCPDIFLAPSSSCKVPTAVPGRSLHELGLAIDISSNGRSVNDRKGAAFTWLAANAARYGFVNLPSEPWHWSITGS